jgi:hypothetical protein
VRTSSTFLLLPLFNFERIKSCIATIASFQARFRLTLAKLVSKLDFLLSKLVLTSSIQLRDSSFVSSFYTVKPASSLNRYTNGREANIVPMVEEIRRSHFLNDLETIPAIEKIHNAMTMLQGMVRKHYFRKRKFVISYWLFERKTNGHGYRALHLSCWTLWMLVSRLVVDARGSSQHLASSLEIRVSLRVSIPFNESRDSHDRQECLSYFRKRTLRDDVNWFVERR